MVNCFFVLACMIIYWRGNTVYLSALFGLGTAGDSLLEHNGHPFTTKDQDNDNSSGSNCATYYRGAWWYDNCYDSNLNGVYHQGQNSSDNGVKWYHFSNYSAKRAQMKIRLVNF